MMTHRVPVNIASALGFALLFVTQQAAAQNDAVYLHSGGSTLRGTVMEVSKEGIKLKKGGATQDVAASDIREIMFDGDPAALTKGRKFAIDGQYDQALEELKTIDFEKLSREMIKEDAAYYIVYSEAQLALQGRGDKAAAVGKARAFAGKSSNSWHFYDVARLLGDLALALKSYDNAMNYYMELRNAPSVDTKIESVYLAGLVQLQKGDTEAAAAEFDKVIGLKVQSAVAGRLQTLAKAGKAVALARTGKGAEGLELVNGLISELNPVDIEMASRIYNAQGASFEASGDKEGAIMAYLHTHLMFSSQPNAHAEALSKLAELWPQVGKPDRAAQARQELKQRYPGF